jgi:hypothetical protein
MLPDEKITIRNADERVELERRLKRSGAFMRAFRGEGEEVLKAIEDFCGYRSDNFSKDPYETAYACGQRSVAVFIHNIIESDINKVKEALKEFEKNAAKA